MRLLHCDSFDGQHATRSALPGFRTVVGQRTDLPDGPPITNGHGLQCEACQAALQALQATSETTERALRLAALNKLRVAAGLTVAELRRIFDARDKGDT
jgi:hypothetical protein